MSRLTSWQAASGLGAQGLESQSPFLTLAADKLPGGKMFYAGIFADLSLIARARHAALDIWNVLEGRLKHFLLVGAMRAPVSAVHLRRLCSQTLRERIEAAAALPQSQVDHDSKGGDDQQRGNDLARR